MRDNERDAVCRKLEEFNFEPVTAENLLPDGTGSWERIPEELLDSDVVVLLLGESYGWGDLDPLEAGAHAFFTALRAAVGPPQTGGSATTSPGASA
jgi:hypothetical protein